MNRIKKQFLVKNEQFRSILVAKTGKESSKMIFDSDENWTTRLQLSCIHSSFVNCFSFVQAKNGEKLESK